jgi:hypothetical protein
MACEYIKLGLQFGAFIVSIAVLYLQYRKKR